MTGILTDAVAVSRLLHAHGALSFWDYAAAGPYVPICVAPSAPGAGDHEDAVFLSPHKFPVARRHPACWWCAGNFQCGLGELCETHSTHQPVVFYWAR